MNPDLNAGLVSIIIPCFNMERHIHRMLDSILRQTYRNIELILVNDGSTDSTMDIILEYAPRLRNFCREFKIINQENSGPAMAVNAGLKVFTGEFLTWPDADDWLEPDSLESRVDLMRIHPEVGLLRSNVYFQDEGKDIKDETLVPMSGPNSVIDEFFESLLYRKAFFGPICYFARSSMFLSLLPDRNIYAKKNGSQNLQMLLPISQAYPVLSSPKVTGTYLRRPDSRSQSVFTKKPEASKLYQRHTMIFDIIENTLGKLRFGNAIGVRAVRQHNIRNVILPLAMRCGFQNELQELIKRCDIGAYRKLLLRFLAWFRCSGIFRFLDRMCGSRPAEASARVVSLIARFPASECVWDSNLNQKVG